MSNLLGIWRYAINRKRCDPAEERMLGVLHGSCEFERGIIPQIRILGEDLRSICSMFVGTSARLMRGSGWLRIRRINSDCVCG